MAARKLTIGTPAPHDAAVASPDASGASDADLALVLRALEGLRFGECVISVHDGKVVQVSRTEKFRPKARP